MFEEKFDTKQAITIEFQGLGKNPRDNCPEKEISHKLENQDYFSKPHARKNKQSRRKQNSELQCNEF